MQPPRARTARPRTRAAAADSAENGTNDASSSGTSGGGASAPPVAPKTLHPPPTHPTRTPSRPGSKRSLSLLNHPAMIPPVEVDDGDSDADEEDEEAERLALFDLMMAPVVKVCIITTCSVTIQRRTC